MTKMFKRSFRGYDLESIEQEIDRINHLYNDRISELKKEISILTHQRELLTSEYNRLKQDIDQRVKMEEEVKEQLYEKYLELLEKHLTAKRKAEASIASLKNQVKLKQEELLKYKGYSKKIKADIIRIRDRFKTMLEEEGVED